MAGVVCVELASLTGEEASLEKAADIVHAFMDDREHGLFSASLALAAFGVRERRCYRCRGKRRDPGLLPCTVRPLQPLSLP